MALFNYFRAKFYSMKSKSEILISRRDEVREITDFYLSKAIHPDLFKDIVRTISNEGLSLAEKNRIAFGMFTYKHFLSYKKSADMNLVRYVLEALEEKLLIISMDFIPSSDKIYQPNENYAKQMNDFGLIENIIFGFEFIINNYRKSVYKIENTANSGDKDIGTGFLVSHLGDNLIITNHHVIDKAKEIKIFDVDDNELGFEILVSEKELDVAILKLNLKPKDTEYLVFNSIQKVLSEIITIGYPSIPMTKEAYQVYHRGEINSHIEDYMGNKLFLISAKTSSGNSGSPVIDKTGLVVGMITRELFEKGALLEKGKLPYYGVIPSNTILELINKL